jgi:hypothetical protein
MVEAPSLAEIATFNNRPLPQVPRSLRANGEYDRTFVLPRNFTPDNQLPCKPPPPPQVQPLPQAPGQRQAPGQPPPPPPTNKQMRKAKISIIRGRSMRYCLFTTGKPMVRSGGNSTKRGSIPTKVLLFYLGTGTTSCHCWCLRNFDSRNKYNSAVGRGYRT